MNLETIKPTVLPRGRLRACAYARVSTDHEKQGNSLENQVRTYTKQIKKNPDYQFVDVYADLGISGRSEKRPEFQRMLKDARAGKIDVIITKSISRFARNTVTLLKYVRELKELGITIIFEENNINTSTAEGEMMLTVLASFAQEESRSMSENNKWTWRKKFEKGETMINTTRFLGYDKDENGHLVINEKEAEVVRRIFDMYLSGMGSFLIKKKLNEEGVPTVTGTAWTSGTVISILKNEKYKGDCILQKTYKPELCLNSRPNTGQVQQYYITDDHEPIVSREEWDMAQELIEYNRQKRGIEKGSPKWQNRYPNSGKLICPYCGATLKRCQVYGKKIDWVCSTYIDESKAACKGIRIHEPDLKGRIFTEPTVVEEVVIDGSKYYRYTGKADYDAGIREPLEIEQEKEGSRILPRVYRTRRTAIKL